MDAPAWTAAPGERHDDTAWWAMDAQCARCGEPERGCLCADSADDLDDAYDREREEE